MKILVTGGAGFIGSALIRFLIKHTDNIIINLDSLTYSGSLESLKEVSEDNRYFFEQVDICNKLALDDLFKKYIPDAVMHLAAESHVDHSIASPEVFIKTNIIGTFNLLQVAKAHWKQLADNKKSSFRFHHISTDEVYGDLEGEDDLFSEDTPYRPSSPYSASKACSDHLVRAWHRTYDLPIVITNCSNNYGPFQFPDKLIPLMICNAIAGKPLPIYGDGKQVRDWLFVEDHAEALYKVFCEGANGETYNIGGHNEKTNLEVVSLICDLLNDITPLESGSYQDQIRYVSDRPGHDQRYAIDASKIQHELNWTPSETFESGIKKTILWYLENQDWCENIKKQNFNMS